MDRMATEDPARGKARSTLEKVRTVLSKAQHHALPGDLLCRSVRRACEKDEATSAAILETITSAARRMRTKSNPRGFTGLGNFAQNATHDDVMHVLDHLDAQLAD
jgi:hypothetical protein